MAIEVNLLFDSMWVKQQLMREICDSISESLDMRLEWHGNFDEAYNFTVKRGALAIEHEDNTFDDFDAGIYDDDMTDYLYELEEAESR